MTWAIVPATEAHAHYLAPRLNDADVAECWAMAHVESFDALRLSLRHSLFAYTWVIDGEPACMYGLSAFGLLDPVGHPWMLGTGLVRQHRMAFLRNYRRQIDEMLRLFTTLETYIDARHAVCLKWLNWTGFAIEAAEPWGVDGMPFHRVRLSR